MVASDVKNRTMIRVTLLCGRVLSGRALWRLLISVPGKLGNGPTGPGEASKCREAEIAARPVLPLNCCAITLTVGVMLKEEKKTSCVGLRHFKRQFGRG